MRSIKQTALAFDRACTATGCDYALVGGFAVMAWGQPRATMDVDALLSLERQRIDQFVDALNLEALAVDKDALVDTIANGGQVTVFDTESSYHVDVKPALTQDEKDEVSDATSVVFEDGKLRVAKAEDTIVHKLRFGSEQDLKDALSILVRRADHLDEERLNSIAARLGMTAQLEKLMRRARGG